MEAKLHANPIRIPTVAQHPMLAKHKDLRLGYGDLRADVFTQAVGQSAESLAAMTRDQRTTAIEGALQNSTSASLLGTMIGRQNVSTRRAAEERFFRQSYQGAGLPVDKKVSTVGMFQRYAKPLVEQHGDRRLSEILAVSSRLTGGKVKSASQFKRLPTASRKQLVSAISAELSRPIAEPETPKPAAVKGSLFGALFGSIKRAITTVAATAAIILGTLGFVGNSDQAPQVVDPVKAPVVQTLVPGDNLFDIDAASDATQSWQELWTMNPHLTNPDLILAGDNLVTDGPRSNPQYAVQRGDTACELATRFGVDLQALADANPHVADINKIYYGPNGTVLTIPLVDAPAADASAGCRL